MPHHSNLYCCSTRLVASACAEPAASGLVLNLITSACAEPCSARLMFWLVLKLLHLAKMSAPRCVSQKAYSTTATALASPTQNSSMRCTWSKFLLQHLSDCSRCVVQKTCSTKATVLAAPTQNSSRRCTWYKFNIYLIAHGVWCRKHARPQQQCWRHQPKTVAGAAPGLIFNSNIYLIAHSVWCVVQEACSTEATALAAPAWLRCFPHML